MEKQRRHMHPTLANGGWAGRCRRRGQQCFVRFLPECLTHNQSKLTWASKPDCGIATTSRKKLEHDTARTMYKTKDRTEIAGCPPVTGSQSHKGWKGAITAQERHYLPKCKQASLLTKTSGVLDSHHAPEKGHQRYTQKTKQQRGERP